MNFYEKICQVMGDESHIDSKKLLIKDALLKLGWTPPDKEDAHTAKFAETHQDAVNEVVDNLFQTIDEAGGSINADLLLNRSLIDVLVNVFSTNGIRFHFKRRNHA
jgi:hypothetical protein